MTARTGGDIDRPGAAVVLATRGTREEEFARQQMRHLAGKGVRVYERTVDRDGDGERDE